MSSTLASQETLCVGLFDTEERRTWYSLLQDGKLTYMGPSQFPEHKECDACFGRMSLSRSAYATEGNNNLYHDFCHERGTKAIEVMQCISRGEAKAWSQTEGESFQSCSLSLDWPASKLIKNGPSKGGVQSGPTGPAVHSLCRNRFLIQKEIYRESKSNTDWVTKISDTLGPSFLAEAERLGLIDPKTKTTRETDLDLDYIFAEPTAE